MADYAAWIALAATCIAALLTAANLGTRTTGWGFVIFTGGAAAWVVVGLTTGQKQLLYSNVFLGLVDLFGVWRWLGHRARIDDSVAVEQDRRTADDGEQRFSVAKLVGLPVRDPDGATVAEVVDALAACEGGAIGYLVVCRGGIAGVGATLHRLPWRQATVGRDEVRVTLSDDEVARLPLVTA